MIDHVEGKISPGYETEGRVVHWARVYDALFGWFLGRTHYTIVKLAAPMPGEEVLNVGCGTGSLTLAVKAALGSRGTIYNIDTSPEMVELAQCKAKKSGRELDFCVGLAEKLPFADRTYDLVMSQFAIRLLSED